MANVSCSTDYEVSVKYSASRPSDASTSTPEKFKGTSTGKLTVQGYLAPGKKSR